MGVYRALKIRLPYRLVEERPDVLDLAVRMHLAAEEYARRLLKELTGQEELKLTPEELDALLTPDKKELAHRIIEETFPKYGLRKYFIDQAKVFWRDVVFHRMIPLNAQLRIENERDRSKAVFVDLKNGVIKVRRLEGTFVIRIREKTAKWIRERIAEGAKLKLAFLGIERQRGKREPTYRKFYVALVFAREVTPVEPRGVVAVDVNRLDHGIVAGLLVDGKLRHTLRLPGERAIKELKRLHEEISRLDERAAGEADPAKRRQLEDRVRYLKSKRYRKIRGVVKDVVGEIIKLAREHQAAIVVDTMEEETYRELKEGSWSGEKKHLLDGLGQLRRRLKELAEWYGLPYLEERLYSTVCPRCGAEMEELNNRRMRCPSCGFNDDRDNIPLLWAKRLYNELIAKAVAGAQTTSAQMALSQTQN
ncbi:zinc ribbon domain-containing protein [Pyrobaculum neutrophilum]|uniref:Transposase IS605 OrfB n=1 Tax=Pyrobaculum neutrophilum (strain DSM 2338 / JCM 9278 / NBRC 100436 / V24Sta) TaxID=444157 RepID=B1YAH8_PYRNV|nr:zinc ribbon domain-containing protein [Pyrobaculum neutrophilum]ACB40627.1 transposase IS605 OrfB [Pyrobaculum neutrophilum V24Sta]